MGEQKAGSAATQAPPAPDAAAGGRIEAATTGGSVAEVPGPRGHRTAVAVGPDQGTELDTIATNRAGRASGLTTFTPLRRRWSPLLRLLLAFKTRQGPDPTLRRLSFIHVAYWVQIDRFPGEERRSKYSYLMFISNFNGSWFDYIDAFSVAVPLKMALLWGSSFGFPGALPPRPFTNYIRSVDKPLIHYYSAYPKATATEIASAVRVKGAFDDLLVRTAQAGDDALVKEWRQFLGTVQRDL